MGSQCVNKQSLDFPHHWEKLFPTELPPQWSINTVNVLSFGFEQCFGAFTMLHFEGSSETGLFSRLSNHVFRSP